MTLPIHNQTLCEGVKFLSLPDDRFKTVCLTVALFLPLEEATASEQAILPFLLRRGCAAYPDFTALNRQLNRLYGARVSGEVSRIGESQVLLLRASSIDDRYALDGEPVSAAVAELLRGMLFEPALENDLFREADIEQERRCLLEEIESEINEKRLYARHQCEKLVCEGERYAVNRYGTVDGVKALTARQITDAWKRVLATARVQIIYQGNQDSAAISAAFAAAFNAFERAPVTCGTEPAMPQRDAELKNRTEEMAVNQCKMVLGFRLGITEPAKQALSARLMNALFGATPYSMLFKNVREKMSLCYYCSSTYDRFKGILLVDCGVEYDMIDKARSEILRQLRLLQGGIVTDEDLESARRAVITQFSSVDDLQSTQSGWYLGYALLPDFVTPVQAADHLADVTLAEVVAVAKKVTLDAVYILKGTEGGETDE